MLLPGDVLLWKVTPDSPWFDRLIGRAERGLGDQVGTFGYYHCAFVSYSDQWMWSAQPPRIYLYPIPLPLPSYIEVKRVVGGLTPVQLENIFKYAKTRAGKWYDFLGVLTAGLIEIGGLEFCSKFLVDSFSYAPLEVCPDKTIVTPDDVASSKIFQPI